MGTHRGQRYLGDSIWVTQGKTKPQLWLPFTAQLAAAKLRPAAKESDGRAEGREPD